MNCRRATEQDFLPAVLEVMEKPPSPAGRATIWVLIMVTGSALLWACLGRVDIVTIASGKIVPSGRIKAVQAAQLGIVRHIHVTEGQTVEVGELLLELDPSMPEADQARISDALQALTLERQRQQLFSDVLNNSARGEPPLMEPVFDGHAGDSEDSGPIALQHQILINQWTEFRALKIAAEQELEANLEEQNSARANLDKYRAILPLITERVEAIRKMVDRDLIPRVRWNELEQERVEAENEIGVLNHRQLQLRANAERIRQEFTRQEARLLNSVHSRLAELDKEISGLEQELVKARSLTRRQQLLAPVAGTVHRMEVHTVGGVVKPAEPLMYIVPGDAGLEVEAWVKNKDVGFVEAGQETEIKVETFPFTKYGSFPGRVASVSQDAIADADHGLVYRTKIILERSTIEIGERIVALTPGMAVTAELKTGKRRLIEFLMSPLLRYKNEFARER
ncbi:MAG: HlyD family type I secretion periplasmic adaptor subunit [Gammaproteobacteria bacterium]|nr:HlyD family type I secretion periplasmic adaptor subunit [Gammaproteobacteria bacterium]